MFTFTRYWLKDGVLQEEQCKCRVEGATVQLVEGAALPCVTQLAESGAGYATSIRRIAFDLWQGAISFDQAFGLMRDTIRLGMNEAWAAGAKQCGIVPAEYSAKEMSELAWMIGEQQSATMKFLYDVEAGSEKNGGKWTPIQARANVWGNRYAEAKNRAALMSCGNQKLAWQLHGLRTTKVSCVDCLKYNGRVYRASTWARYDIRPQSPRLACRGFNCGCSFSVTDEKCTPGRPPNYAGG